MKTFIRARLLALTIAVLGVAIGATSGMADDLVDCKLSREKPDEALSACTRLIEKGGLTNSDLAMIYTYRGKAWDEEDEVVRALADYSKALELDPNNTDAYFARGVYFFDTKAYDRAITDFNKALDLDPKDNDARIWRGAAYLRMGNLERAIADHNKALELDPENFWAFSNLAETYTTEGRDSDALAVYRKLTTLELPKGLGKKNLSQALNARAWAFFTVGNAAKGLPDADEGLRLVPNNANSLDTRAHIYEALARKDEAIVDYRNALKQDPNLAESKEGLKRLGVEP